jgi:SAM-dependent methyltransferase
MLMNSNIVETVKQAFVSQLRKNYEVRDDDSKQIFLSKIVEKYPINGVTMVDEINSLEPSLVIDLGCGLNQYKGLINNLVGVDVVGCREDIVADITNLKEHFADHTADVVLALGSINFGQADLIESQLKEVKRLLKPGGVAYFRANQNDHDKDHKGDLRYYDWSKDLVEHWATQLGFEIVGEVTVAQGSARIRDRMDANFVGQRRSNIRLFWKWRAL